MRRAQVAMGSMASGKHILTVERDGKNIVQHQECTSTVDGTVPISRCGDPFLFFCLELISSAWLLSSVQSPVRFQSAVNCITS